MNPVGAGHLNNAAAPTAANTKLATEITFADIPLRTSALDKNRAQPVERDVRGRRLCSIPKLMPPLLFDFSSAAAYVGPPLDSTSDSDRRSNL